MSSLLQFLCPQALVVLTFHFFNNTVVRTCTNSPTSHLFIAGAALKHILHSNFKPNVGMRADSQKIVILITDGDSQDDVTVPLQDLEDTGIEIYVVGD